MPWTASDAPKHNKNLSRDSQERWARIANSVLARTGDDGQAIRIANSRVKPSIHRAIRRRLYG